VESQHIPSTREAGNRLVFLIFSGAPGRLFYTTPTSRAPPHPPAVTLPSRNPEHHTEAAAWARRQTALSRDPAKGCYEAHPPHHHAATAGFHLLGGVGWGSCLCALAHEGGIHSECCRLCRAPQAPPRARAVEMEQAATLSHGNTRTRGKCGVFR
jgi:hypothetical protein